MKSRFKLMIGDNIESLKKLPDNSIDSVVSDPPYGLSFMGKKWDYDVPSVEFWKEVYRVLKPGGHVLSFGGTRTYHRMVVNIEDAGFEIRDQIQWIYASGFPKSLNVKKQFGKNGYKICECTEQNTEHDLRPLSEANISQTINPESEQGKTLLSELPKQDIQISEHTTRHVWREQSSVEGRSNSIQEEGQLQGNNIQESTGTSERNGEKRWIHNGTQNDNGSNGEPIIDENRSSSSHRPQSEQQSSEQSGTMADKRRSQESRSRKICGRCGEQIILGLDNLGTSLKPANEPICVARKPLSEKSVALNVLKWGTGGINIDGCRVGSEELNEGRFPANIILDEIAGELLDEQSGNIKGGKNMKPFQAPATNDIKMNSSKVINRKGYEDNGGASRFFYNAKVSKKERNMALDGFEDKRVCQGGYDTDWSSDKEGDIGINKVKNYKNNHPTVKPVSLMTYLCRLVTPENGIVLDPFMGSGSTGIAALLEGFRFVGMEMDPEYMKIAQARIENYEKYREFIKK